MPRKMLYYVIFVLLLGSGMETVMFEELKKILVDQLYLTDVEVTPESRIKADLGADSLDVLQLLLTIQEKMGITIPDEELSKFETVGDVVAYLEAHR